MTRAPMSSCIIAITLMTGAALLMPHPVRAQGGPDRDPRLREAYELDRQGNTQQARAIYRDMLASPTDPAAKARVHRSMAMSYAFDRDCDNTAKYEMLVIAYWMTREAEEPQEAFYQQGEMANEAGRACLDAGDLDKAEWLYRLGHELGTKEPEPLEHPVSLWDYRLAHALGRIAARRGNAADAWRQVRAARRILDGDPEMADGQARYLPYLEGYVALYTNDLETAEAKLTEAVSHEGNQRDAFMRALLAMTYERQGRTADAQTMYREAYERATSHNPPSAFVRPFARQKLGLGTSP
jgi:tetratricopeptide (TPR) repeat protein